MKRNGKIVKGQLHYRAPTEELERGIKVCLRTAANAGRKREGHREVGGTMGTSVAARLNQKRTVSHTMGNRGLWRIRDLSGGSIVSIGVNP